MRSVPGSAPPVRPFVWAASGLEAGFAAAVVAAAHETAGPRHSVAGADLEGGGG